MAREQEIKKERLKKIQELKEKKIEVYGYFFDKKDSANALQDKYRELKPGHETKDKAKTAGRVMIIRDMGKINFASLQDSSGKIQIILQDGETPEKVIDFFKKYIDAGDFIGAEGRITRTKRGELSILAEKIELLSKALLPLPEKWHGLTDKEERYRKRYLDLIMNPEVKEVFEKREKIISTIREFLKERKFVEVETPILQPLYGGAEARPFITHLYALNTNLYLGISPELYLKKLIAGGFEKVFTICKNFRNEGIDRLHNPEFTMLELYESYKDYNDMMELTENLISSLVKKMHGKTKIEYQGKIIDFKVPFKRVKLIESIKKEKINLNKLNSREINEIFEEKIQPKLIEPTFIIDYPIELCPLTKEHRKDKKFVERFELFINGGEIANAYSELNDPIEQERRLKKQIEERKKAKDYDSHFEANVIDEDFIESMSYGMPPLGGVGVGIDRLAMLLTNQPSIRDVILFPFMRKR